MELTVWRFYIFNGLFIKFHCDIPFYCSVIFQDRGVIIVLNNCCILRGDDSDRTYLRCCSIRAWTRLRCL